MAQGLIVLVARQRTGSTALAQAWSRGSQVQSLGEVFHHVRSPADGIDPADLYLQPEHNFYVFRAAMIAANPELNFPTQENVEVIFRNYVDALLKKSQKPWVMIDIKYNAWRGLEPIYTHPGGPPHLLWLLARFRTRFIHLARRNAFERYCSEQIALQTGRWHTLPGETPPVPGITIDPRDARRDMLATRRQYRLFRRWLLPHPGKIELFYEELFGKAGHLSGPTQHHLGRLVQSDADAGHAIPLGKLTPPLASVVTNSREIIAAFEGSIFEADVRRALAPPAAGSPKIH